jgi:hypothetical protein
MLEQDTQTPANSKELFSSIQLNLFRYSSDWVSNHHRDTITSVIGHPNLLDYISLVENESRARSRFHLLQVSVVSIPPPYFSS